MHMISTVLYFLLAIGILVVIHEMGHYLAARACGIQVLRFSVGFGRSLIQWRSKGSTTEWVVAAVPLGGYVRMDDASFESKSLLARSFVVSAGPLANLIFAALAYALLFSIGRDEPEPVIAQPPVASAAAAAGLAQGDRLLAVDDQPIRSFTDLRWRVAQAYVGEGRSTILVLAQRPDSQQFRASLVPARKSDEKSSGDATQLLNEMGLFPNSRGVKLMQIQADSAAAKAGLIAGDRIVAIQDQPVIFPGALIQTVKTSAGAPLTLSVAADGMIERVTIRPLIGADGVPRIGAVVAADVATIHVSESPVNAVIKGVTRSWEMSLLTFSAMGRMVMGEISWRQISGPVTIADAAGQSAQSGLIAFIGFLALISISIAVLNLLPIPMLDGGHLLYYLWEFVRGRPLPAEVQETGRRMGLVLIMGLTVVALVNDFARIAGW
jgi:regulator of sigma E protease